MGGAQPLAVTMNDGVVLIVDVDQHMLQRRVDHRYLDEIAPDYDAAVRRATEAKAARTAAVGRACSATPPTCCPGCSPTASTADIVTDQTSAHDPLSYVPNDLSHEAADGAASQPSPTSSSAAAERRWPPTARRWSASWTPAPRCSTTATACEPRPSSAASTGRSTTPASCPPTSGRCSARARARSAGSRCPGDPADIAATDRAVLEEFPDDEALARWITMARERVAFQGLPARICWLGYGERHRLGLRFNEMVRSGELSAPVVIGRDHLDSGSVASPYRETEDMLDGSDAIADWPLLNGLVNACSGATWVSIHHGGGVGIGRSIHAGQVSVADGTDLAAQKLERVLTNDPGTGVIRHVDAGYERAIEVAAERGVRVPMREGSEGDAQ